MDSFVGLFFMLCFLSDSRIALSLQPFPLELEGHINLGTQNDCILIFVQWDYVPKIIIHGSLRSPSSAVLLPCLVLHHATKQLVFVLLLIFAVSPPHICSDINENEVCGYASKSFFCFYKMNLWLLQELLQNDYNQSHHCSYPLTPLFERGYGHGRERDDVAKQRHTV
uniref:Putative secreted protein n=1 Tax=Ixodes ricinus TaxID=34613 RepID=A0A6B0UYP2_IXORI